jgi:hypothetical protein
MLSTSAYEADGVWRGQRADLDENQYPEFLGQTELAPAYGFAVESAGVSFLNARATYRKVLNRDRVVLSPFPDDDGNFDTLSETRTSTEKVGGAVVSTAPSLGSIHGSAIYDLYLRAATEHAAGVDWFVTDDLSVGTAYDYYEPTFDGDSIFNWFSHHGMLTLDAHASWRLSRRVSTALRGGVRRLSTDGDPDDFDVSTSSPAESSTAEVLEPLGSARLDYRLPAVDLTTSLMGEGGKRARRLGGDVGGLHRVGVVDASWLLSVYDFEDAYRPTRGATSFTYVLGFGMSPFRAGRFGLEWEHSMNAVSGQRLRLAATLEVRVE